MWVRCIPAYAAVQYMMHNDNYHPADRFDLQTYDSSYELTIPHTS
jgi:hypothetical protein